MSTHLAPAPTSERVLAQAAFEARTLLANGEQLLVSLVLPALALFGMVHLGVPALPPGERVSTAVPGVLALVVVSTAFTGQAIATAFDRRYGLLRLLGVTPLGPRGLVAGKALAVLGVVTVLELALGALGLAMGWRPRPAGLPAAVVLVVLGSWVFVALALVLAGSLRSEAVLALANLIWVALLVGGGLVAPTRLLPDGWASVARLLPSGALGDGLRAALGEGSLPLGPVLVLLVWGLASTAVASRVFRWSA